MQQNDSLADGYRNHEGDVLVPGRRRLQRRLHPERPVAERCRLGLRRREEVRERREDDTWDRTLVSLQLQ